MQEVLQGITRNPDDVYTVKKSKELTDPYYY